MFIICSPCWWAITRPAALQAAVQLIIGTSYSNVSKIFSMTTRRAQQVESDFQSMQPTSDYTSHIDLKSPPVFAMVKKNVFPESG